MPRSHFDWTARKDLAIDALDAICEDQTSRDLIETDVNTRLHSQGRGVLSVISELFQLRKNILYVAIYQELVHS